MDWLSRKFLLTAAVTLTAITALFLRFVDQQHFLWIATLTLGMYKTANVLESKMNGDK